MNVMDILIATASSAVIISAIIVVVEEGKEYRKYMRNNRKLTADDNAIIRHLHQVNNRS